jgi:YD repeat-containing protein
MKIEYDPKPDAMYIRLLAGEVAGSDEVREGVVLDYDAEGRVVGIEMLDVSRRVDNPRKLTFELLVSATNRLSNG